MKEKLIRELLGMILKLVSPSVLMAAADKLLDAIEDAVTASSTQVDDFIVLPLCKKVREAFGIED